MKARDLSQPMSVTLRPVPEDFRGSFGVTVCVNVRPTTGIITVSCGPRGGIAIAEAIETEVARRKLAIRVSTIQCLGLCEKGPNVRLTPSNSWFNGVHLSDVPAIIGAIEGQMKEKAQG